MKHKDDDKNQKIILFIFKRKDQFMKFFRNKKPTPDIMLCCILTSDPAKLSK